MMTIPLPVEVRANEARNLVALEARIGAMVNQVYAGTEDRVKLIHLLQETRGIVLNQAIAQ